MINVQLVNNILIKLSNQILVQENDYVKAGTPMSEGSITPNDILNIKGPSAVQQYLVNEVQEVYRLQGFKINDKHFEVVVRQMMRKVKINDMYDLASLTKILATLPLIIQEVDRNEINLENSINDLMPEWSYTNKKDILLKDILEFL